MSDRTAILIQARRAGWRTSYSDAEAMVLAGPFQPQTLRDRRDAQRVALSFNPNGRLRGAYWGGLIDSYDLHDVDSIITYLKEHGQ